MRSFLLPLLRNSLDAIGAPEGSAIPLGPPREAEHGDLATSVALTLARELGETPRAIAERIVAALQTDERYLEEPEITDAGFINFRFTPPFFQMRLGEALALGEGYGRLDIGNGKRVSLDYVQVNPAAPLHGAHCRTEALGDSIAAILAWCGFDVANDGSQQMESSSELHDPREIIIRYDDDERRVAVNQSVVFVKGGKRVKLSGRDDAELTLETLNEELGADLFRFYLLKESTSANLEIDLDQAREHSERNPFYYLRYAHARVAGVIRHAESEGLITAGDAQLSLLTQPEELDLIKSIILFPEKTARAANDLAPHIIADYLRDLATTFNRFYQACRIVIESPLIRDARLQLLHATHTTLANGMRLLGVHTRYVPMRE